MSNKYAKVRPGQDMMVSAGLYNDAVDYFGPAAGFEADRKFGSKPQGVVVKVKNVSGSDRSRWDCMALGDTRFTIGNDGAESVIFEVDTAAAEEAPAILQEPIADGKFGDALIFGYTLARIKTASAATDLRGTPNATDHNLSASSDGPVQILAAPSISAASLRPVLVGAAAGGGNSHYLYTLTAAMSSGTGTATIRSIDDSDEVDTAQTVVDTLGFFDGLAIGKRGICIKAGSSYYAIGPYVTDVRWNNPVLEQSKDGGSAYDNIDTAGPC